MRDRERIGPDEIGEKLASQADLRISDEKGHAASGGEQATGNWQYGFESFNRAQGKGGCGRACEGFGASGNYIDVSQCSCAADFTEECSFLLTGLDESEFEMRSPDLYGDSREAGAGTEIDEVWVRGTVKMHGSLAGIRFAQQNGFSAQDDIGVMGMGNSRPRRLFNSRSPDCISDPRSGSQISLGMTGTIGEEVTGGEEGFAEVTGDDVFRVADGGEIDAGVPAE